jgi:hypothetical protein
MEPGRVTTTAAASENPGGECHVLLTRGSLSVVPSVIRVACPCGIQLQMVNSCFLCCKQPSPGVEG